MASFWDKLAALDVPARVVLGAEIQPKRRAPGRPRRVRASRWSEYAGYDPTTGKRPRCNAPGCFKWLRRDQRMACCPEHEQTVQREYARLRRIIECAA